MGTFTQDTAVCDEPFHASVPMWLTQLDFTITEDTIIENPVNQYSPEFAEQYLAPQSCLHSSLITLPTCPLRCR